MAGSLPYKRSSASLWSTVVANLTRKGLPEDPVAIPDDSAVLSLFEALVPGCPHLLDALHALEDFTSRPDVAHELLKRGDLAAILISLLSESLPAAACAAVFAVLSHLLEIPGMIDHFIDLSILDIVDRFRLELMRQFKTADRSIVLHFLGLLRRLARPPVVAGAFTKSVVFLRFCVADRCLPVAERAFHVARRITRLDCGACGLLLEHDFLRPALCCIRRCCGPGGSAESDALFGAACRLAGRLIVNDDRVIGHVPPDFVPTLADAFVRVTPGQAAAFGRFMRDFELNHALFGGLCLPEFIAALVGVCEEREFTVARVALDCFLTLLSWAPDGMGEVVRMQGSLDFLARFFETGDAELIGDILLGVNALASRWLTGGADARLMAVFESSPALMAAVECVHEGECEFQVTEDMAEAAEQLLGTIRG
jgi:hypothetical protein